MEDIYLPEIKLTKKEGAKGVFTIEPLSPGYGVTIGNSLRRVLLSSLEGAAITSVKIKGVTHEFTTFPGIKEDGIELILNLKSVRVKCHSDKPITAYLKVKGPADVKAKDIKVPSEVEIVNPNQAIATLGPKAELDMELKIERGRGYVPVESREMEKSEVGVIQIDALYSPIVKVAYNVERARVGKVTNLDKLVLEIITDGTITPEEALKQAAALLVEQFSLFTSEGGKVKKKEYKEEKKVKKYSIEELDFSERTANMLLANGITDTDKLSKKTEEELKSIKGLGKVAVEEIKTQLNALGLSLKEPKTKK